MSADSKTIKLIMVTQENNNKFYNMFDHGDGTMHVEYGRVELTNIRKDYSLGKWDSLYRSKTKKGYEDVTRLYTEVIEDASSNKKIRKIGISDNKIRTMFEELQNYANVTVKENYSVTSASVTQAMVDEAQVVVDDLIGMLKINANVGQLNENLMKLFKIIPRYIKKVQLILFTEIENKKHLDTAKKKMVAEQDILDTMAGQVLATSKTKVFDDQNEDTNEAVNVLDQLGLEIENITSQEEQIIKQALGDSKNNFSKAFKVINKETQKKYNRHSAKFHSGPRKEEFFWHGSRNQNIYFILQKGLLIRPSGAIHTGSMFGDGIYFADKARKSIGYSSLSGSYWSGGSSSKGFLILYAVDVGKQKKIKRHDSSCYRLSRKVMDNEGYDSVYAQGGMDLRNNEYIVYEGEKCTVKYLVELKN